MEIWMGLGLAYGHRAMEPQSNRHHKWSSLAPVPILPPVEKWRTSPEISLSLWSMSPRSQLTFFSP